VPAAVSVDGWSARVQVGEAVTVQLDIRLQILARQPFPATLSHMTFLSLTSVCYSILFDTSSLTATFRNNYAVCPIPCFTMIMFQAFLIEQ